MSDDTNPLEDAVEQALDTFVYAPIGLVFEGPALFPSLVQKGRNQVKVARMMGEMAVQMGQKEAAKRAKTAQDHMRSSLAAAGLVPTPHSEASGPNGPGPEPSTTEKTAPKKATKKKATKKKAATTKAGGAKTARATSSTPSEGTGPKPSPDGLGIPDYDSLSASQVVSRLRGLGSDELERVKNYESATRARKTILNKITQLQKD